MILSTSQERVKLLKAGFTGKQIEGLYVLLNDFKVLRDIQTKIPPEDKASSPLSFPVNYANAEVAA